MPATFNFPFHRVRTKYPETGFRAQFGGGYLFAAAPSAPDQRTFTLGFQGMRYYVDGAGDVDETLEPTKNMKALEDFYVTHKLHVTFIYIHPVHGSINVRFGKPLETPYGYRGGAGTVEPFEIELLEQP